MTLLLLSNMTPSPDSPLRVMHCHSLIQYSHSRSSPCPESFFIGFPQPFQVLTGELKSSSSFLHGPRWLRGKSERIAGVISRGLLRTRGRSSCREPALPSAKRSQINRSVGNQILPINTHFGTALLYFLFTDT